MDEKEIVPAESITPFDDDPNPKITEKSPLKVGGVDSAFNGLSLQAEEKGEQS